MLPICASWNLSELRLIGAANALTPQTHTRARFAHAPKGRK